MAERPSPGRILAAVILVASTWLAWRRAVGVALAKAFTLDEFQWAHAAWLVSRGEVPYRDFFEVHFPLNYQYMSLAFSGAANDPTAISTMREMMLPVLMLAAWGMWRVNRRDGWDFALLAPVFALSLPSWVVRATEIRHDPLGFALFIAAIAWLYTERIPLKLRSALAGLSLGLACWATQKVLIYGCIFAGAAVADLMTWRRREGEAEPVYLLGAPLYFIAAAGGVVILIAGWLSLNGAWEPFYRWCFEWAADYQQKQASFSWFSKLVPMLRYAWWNFLLAGVGIATTLRMRKEAGPDEPKGGLDLLLLLAWLSTWVSWAIQQAPWSYSAVPFLGMTCIFAARGAAAILRGVSASPMTSRSSQWAIGTTLTLLYALAMWRAGHILDEQTRPRDFFVHADRAERYFDDEEQNLGGLPDDAKEQGLEFDDPTEDEDEPKPRTRAERIARLDRSTPKWERFFDSPEWAQLEEPANEYQLRVLAKVAELTAPEDVCHDNTGAFVARPHAYYFWYTFDSIWRLQRETLIEELPASLEAEGAVLVLTDSRSKRQPKPIRRWLQRNYRPYNADIWMNGRSYDHASKDEPLTGDFVAMADGEYFIYPAQALKGGALRIDGKRQNKPSFTLEAGDHEIEYTGRPIAFSVLWLPRNGERWHPNPEGDARFCCPKTTF